MSLSISMTVKVPVSYFPRQIARRISHHQAVNPRATTSSAQTWTTVKSNSVVVRSSADPGPQIRSDRSDPWKAWLLGVIMSTVLSFFGSKWGPLMKMKNQVEEVVEKADRVTETVEEVAKEVDKIAEEIETDLPEAGKLREVVVAVDEVAKTTVKDAELVEDVIHKVEKVEKDVDSFMESDDDPKSSTTSKRGD